LKRSAVGKNLAEHFPRHPFDTILRLLKPEPLEIMQQKKPMSLGEADLGVPFLTALALSERYYENSPRRHKKLTD
jgi:hypothetical protein